MQETIRQLKKRRDRGALFARDRFSDVFNDPSFNENSPIGRLPYVKNLVAPRLQAHGIHTCADWTAFVLEHAPMATRQLLTQVTANVHAHNVQPYNDNIAALHQVPYYTRALNQGALHSLISYLQYKNGSPTLVKSRAAGIRRQMIKQYRQEVLPVHPDPIVR